MSEAYETVLNHLLFHKALISEHDGAQRISRYVSMLGEIDQGMHVALRDPFEKAVAAAFELVIEKQLDPWDLDLAQFTRMFLEKVQQGGPVNFVTAGKLIFMAWSILKLQSDYVLVSATPSRRRPPRTGTSAVSRSLRTSTSTKRSSMRDDSPSRRRSAARVGAPSP